MRHFARLVLIITLTFSAGCEQRKDNGALPVEKTDAQIKNDVGIASFLTPNGWMSNRSNGNTLAILAPTGTNPTTATEMISIDVGNPIANDTKSSADGLASKFGGTITSLPFDLDGVEAYRVSIPPNFEKLMPRECVVVHYNEKVCYIFGASKSNGDIWPIVESVAKSWSWN